MVTAFAILAMFVNCGKNMYNIYVAEILKLGIFAFRADVSFCETLLCHGMEQCSGPGIMLCHHCLQSLTSIKK